MRTLPLFLLLVSLPAAAQTPQRIAPPGHFDVGLCFPDPPAAPKTLTSDGASAMLLALRPQLLECLVPAKHRGATAQTSLGLEVTLSPKSPPSLKVDGALPEPGRACLDKAIQAGLGGLTVPEGGVVAKGRIDHFVGVSPGEQAGVSESSDLVASVRLAEPGWCDCFAPWKASSPLLLRMEAKIAAGKATEVKQTEVAAAPEVTACLEQKLKAHPFPKLKPTYTVPLTFTFVHSTFAAAFPAPALQYHQSTARRAQLLARAQLAAADRGLAGDAFNALVTEVKAKKVDRAKLVPACREVIAADEAWVAALEALAAEEEKLVLAATKLKAADGPNWANAWTAVSRQQAETRDELEGIKAQRDADQKTCPK